MMGSRLHSFPLLSSEEVANSPSRRDGMTEAREKRQRKQAAAHMLAVNAKFNRCVPCAAWLVVQWHCAWASPAGPGPCCRCG